MYCQKISPEEIEELEQTTFPGNITIVEYKGRAFAEAIKHLSSQRLIGFDTETKPVFQRHSSRPPTALLQLSSETNAYLFRLTTLGMPQQLANILSDPYITKIGAAVNDDIRGLQHYRYFTPHRFIDLQSMVEDYGITDKAVRKLSAIILGAKISKTQQLSNWEADKLSAGQQAYAATDAWVCLKMYKKLLATPHCEMSKIATNE